MATIINKEKILSNEIDGNAKPPADKAAPVKPPADKDIPADAKPPADKSITQKFISDSIANGDLQVVYQLEILADGSAIMTMYKEREMKPLEQLK